MYCSPPSHFTQSKAKNPKTNLEDESGMLKNLMMAKMSKLKTLETKLS